MQPSIGRIVHLNLCQPDRETYGQEFCAAVITTVKADGMVNLRVFTPNGHTVALENVEHAPDDKPTPNHWNWPPREPAPKPTGTEDTDKVADGRRIHVKG